MHYIGIDLHRRSVMIAVQDEKGVTLQIRNLDCSTPATIRRFASQYQPFEAVIEASSSYRWLYDLLVPLGDVLLAHPLRLRAIVSGRAKTDKLDAQLLASLLRADLIPKAYVPPRSYMELRELTRARARLVRRMVQAKNELRTLLACRNLSVPYRSPFCKSGRRWIRDLDVGKFQNGVRDELLARMQHFDDEIAKLDGILSEISHHFPESEALTGLYGIGLYSALLIIAEIGEPERFANGRKVGAYAGLTARVNQSGGHCYYGHITRQGSSWLRWILVEAAMKIIRHDSGLRNFHTRIRKRSSAKVARVAVARKLAEICWIRLKRWHLQHAA